MRRQEGERQRPVDGVPTLVELTGVLLGRRHIAGVLVRDRGNDDTRAAVLGCVRIGSGAVRRSDRSLDRSHQSPPGLSGHLEGKSEESYGADAQQLDRQHTREAAPGEDRRLQEPRPEHPLLALWSAAAPGLGSSGPERGDAVQYRSGVLERTSHQGRSDGGPVGQLDAVDRSVQIQVHLPQTRTQLHVVAQVTREGAPQLAGLGADAATDALRLQVTGLSGSQVRRNVCVGALDRADHCSPPGLLLDLVTELTDQIRPQIRVVLAGVLRDAGAVHAEHDHGGEWLGTVLGHPVDPQQVQVRVDRHVFALRLQAVIEHGLVVDVRVHRTVPCQPPHLGATERQASWCPGVVRLDHGVGDLTDQETRPPGVEARPVRCESVVEVRSEELARTGVGVGRSDHQAGDADVGALGDPLCDQVLQHRGPPEQVTLHDRQRGSTSAQMNHPSTQSGAEARAVVRVRGVPRLGHAGRGSDVALGGAGEQAVHTLQFGGNRLAHGEPGSAYAGAEERSQRVLRRCVIAGVRAALHVRASAAGSPRPGSVRVWPAHVRAVR